MTRQLLNATLVAMVALSASPVMEARQDANTRAAAVLEDARHALGGAEKLAAVRTLQAVGNNRRRMGDRDMEGELEILIEALDKLRRNEEIGIPGGPSMSRSEVLNGDAIWEDASSRGGMHGGMGGAFVMRMGGPAANDPERMKEMQRRMRRAELGRLLLAWLMKTDAPVTYAGTAEAPDGKAHVLDVKPVDGPTMRLFVDQTTHVPLMLTWQGPQPRTIVRRPGGPGATRPDPEQIRREMEAQGPPPEVKIEMRFSDYRSVGGVMLPHLISRSINGDAHEEWTISSYKINPAFKAGAFDKK